VSGGDPVSSATVAAPERGTARRVAWGMADQVLSSASNFIITVIAAATLSAGAFGAFAMALTICIVAVSLARGLASDPLASAHAVDEAGTLTRVVRASAGVAATVGVASGVLTAVVAALAGGTLGRVLLALAVSLPGLVLQDFLRYALIVQGRAKQTFLNDLFWTVSQVGFIFGAIALGGGPGSLLLAWGVACNLAAVLGLFQARTRIGGVRELRPWLREHRTLWPFFMLDNLVYQVTTLVLVVVISLSTTLAQVGGFRAATTLYAPLAIVGRGVVGVAVPELARRRHDPLAVRRASLLIAWLLAPTAVVWAAVLRLMPESWGHALLGESWTLAEPLLFLAGAATTVALFTVGTVAGIRALGAGRDGLTARVVVSVLVLAAASAGAALNGAHGAFLAMALSAPVQIATWWWQLVRATRVTSAPPEALYTRHDQLVEE
jgi:O-antigen/teichoic acid export membrane protein